MMPIGVRIHHGAMSINSEKEQSREAGVDGGEAADPSAKEEWRQDISPELRKLFVRKLIEILPTTEELCKDEDPNSKYLFAKKIESDLYHAANSGSEYFHFLADRIYKFHLELEEKQQKSVKEQQQIFQEELQEKIEEEQKEKFQEEKLEKFEDEQQLKFQEERQQQQPEAQQTLQELEILRPKDPLLKFKMIIISLAVGIIYQIILLL